MFRLPIYAKAASRQYKSASRILSVGPALLSSRIAPNRAYVRHYSVATDGTDISHMIDKVSDSEYNNLANEYLETLGDDLEDLSEDFPQVDAELTQGVMTVTISSEKTYVINKQPPNKQIWLSSPISGPKRYDLIGGKWVTLRDNTLLTKLLEEEFSSELGKSIQLNVEQ